MDLLEQHFDTAFAAPDGIKKLRELILTLAMQGKLVAQDPNDPPASQLLQEIEAEKKRLVKEGKIKASKPLKEIEPEEAPYALPPSWEWVRFPECYYGIGSKANQIQTNSYLESGAYPVIDQGKAFIAAYMNGIEHLLKLEKPVIVFGDHTKIIKYVDFDFVIGADGVKILCPYDGIAPRFLFRLMQSYKLTDRGYARHFGVLNEKFAPVPPLSEQHRIVAKIDQLMVRCDELEKLRDEREKKHHSVHTAALKQLLDAQVGDSFTDAWQFIAQHFGDLYAVRENVTELRKAIRQLAVMGKLVPQNPNDPPASQLLKEIETEKILLVKEGKIKAPKPLPEIKPEEAPYALPLGWEWVRLGEIGVWKSGSTPSRTNSKYYGGGIPWVKSGEVKQGRISETEESITELALAECSLSLNPKGSVLVAMYGANIGEVGILDIEATTNQAVCACNTYTAFDERYLLNLIASLKQYFISQGAGAAQPNISREKIVATIFPLPPLPEQHRIVAKIDLLMALCDTLEQQIDSSTRKQASLLDAVMAQV